MNDNTQGAASLCPGLGAGCPFRAYLQFLRIVRMWVSAADMVSIRILRGGKKENTLSIHIRKIRKIRVKKLRAPYVPVA